MTLGVTGGVTGGVTVTLPDIYARILPWSQWCHSVVTDLAQGYDLCMSLMRMSLWSLSRCHSVIFPICVRARACICVSRCDSVTAGIGGKR